MKKLLWVAFFLVVFYSCTNYTEKENFTNNEIDTNLTISYKISKESLNSTNEYISDNLIFLKNYIDTGFSNNNFLQYIDARYSFCIQKAMIINKQEIKEIAVLFFLKLHFLEIKNNEYGFNYGCYQNQYICLNLFEIVYLQLSDCKMIDEPPYTYYVYKWLKENQKSKLYKNTKINNLMLQIEEFYSKNNLDL